jgi:hypothetical protein
VLRGFPDPATEAAYLAYKDGRCCALLDPVAAAVSVAILAADLRSSAAEPGQEQNAFQQAVVLASGLLFNAPYAAMLLAKGWYRRRREALLLLCGGAGRVVMAAGQGVMSVATGQDYCSDPGNCLGMLLVSSALHFPLAQQVRLRGALLLALVDACGLCCYALFKLGVLLPAVGLAGAAAGAGLAVVTLLEWRGRRAFLRQVRPAGGHM